MNGTMRATAVLALTLLAFAGSAQEPAPFDLAWTQGAEEVLYAGPPSHLPEALLSPGAPAFRALLDLSTFVPARDFPLIEKLLDAGVPVYAVTADPPLEPEVVVPGAGVAQWTPTGWRFLDYPELAAARLEDYAPIAKAAPQLTPEALAKLKEAAKKGGGSP